MHSEALIGRGRGSVEYSVRFFFLKNKKSVKVFIYLCIYFFGTKSLKVFFFFLIKMFKIATKEELILVLEIQINGRLDEVKFYETIVSIAILQGLWYAIKHFIIKLQAREKDRYMQ